MHSPRRSFLFAALAALGISLAVTDANAQLRWSEREVDVRGTACFKDVDTFVQFNGGDVSITFANFGVNLDRSTPELELTSACSVRLPAQLDAGVFLRRVEQSLSYTVQKSVGSRAQVSVNGTFFGLAYAVPGLALAPDTLVDPPQPRRIPRTDTVEPATPTFAMWCRSARPTAGELRIPFVAEASRPSTSTLMVVRDVRWEAHFEWQSCRP
jgi:hypothetical protein